MPRRRMTPARRARIFEAHDGVCGICDLPIEGRYEIDHRVALGLGGSDDDSNLRPTHPECHRAKTRGTLRTRGDLREIAKAKRIRARRLRGRKIPSRPLTDPRLVRTVDGAVGLRDGSEARMR